MIDFIKILIQDADINYLTNSGALEFKSVVSEKTGELSTKKVAECHFCKITIFENGIVLFTGSIHKMWNSLNEIQAPNFNKSENYKGFNGNQFLINDIIEIRTYLGELLNCEPQQMIFQNIEFGINTTPYFEPKLFLKGLLYHNGKQFEYKYNGHFSQVKHQRYFFKIYDKSNQYGMEDYTLRIELKIIKTEDIKHLGIKTFWDINQDTLKKVNRLLLRRFEEIVYYDYTINKKHLKKRTIQVLERYSNPRYWFEDITVKKRYEHKSKLKNFIVEHSDNLMQYLSQEIYQRGSRLIIPLKTQKGGIINRLSEIPKRGIINRSSIGLIIPQRTKKKRPKKLKNEVKKP